MPISIHRKLYPGRKTMCVVGGIAALAGAMAMVTLLPPTTFFVEILVVFLITSGVFLTVWGIFKNKKGAVILATGILGVLVMGRENILDYLTGGLWVMILILISLFN
jgi:hypothetical protein